MTTNVALPPLVTGTAPVGLIAPPVPADAVIVTAAAAELGGQVSLERLAIRIGQRYRVEEEIADVAVEARPSVRPVAPNVDMGGVSSGNTRHQRSHRAGVGVGVNLSAVGIHLVVAVRLAYQAQHRYLSVRNDIAGGSAEPLRRTTTSPVLLRIANTRRS